jgi:hypothetical protein
METQTSTNSLFKANNSNILLILPIKNNDKN